MADTSDIAMEYLRLRVENGQLKAAIRRWYEADERSSQELEARLELLRLAGLVREGER